MSQQRQSKQTFKARTNAIMTQLDLFKVFHDGECTKYLNELETTARQSLNINDAHEILMDASLQFKIIESLKGMLKLNSAIWFELFHESAFQTELNVCDLALIFEEDKKKILEEIQQKCISSGIKTKMTQ